MQRTEKLRNIMLLLVAILVLAMLLGGAWTIADATGKGGEIREIGLPLGGGHRLQALLIPCSATEAGGVVVGRDLFISSRRQPSITFSTTRPCP
jgi:hypothetical protein